MDPSKPDGFDEYVKKLLALQTSCQYCGRKRPQLYMLKDHLWEAIRRGRDYLCIRCADREIAELLGRPLEAGDFTPVPINELVIWALSRGATLLS